VGDDTPYWRSEEKGKAWTLLIAVIAALVDQRGISVWFNTWYKDFYNACRRRMRRRSGVDPVFLRHCRGGDYRCGVPPLT
jgi:ABC-type uncharacterized transport system fused permease/ATPase subunit